VNQVTSQLKRLSGLGYVRAANVRARSSWYSLAEPLYAIWHQMRFGRESRERMAWLVEFLKAWYSSREMLDETERLAARFAEMLKMGEKALAAETLDYRQILVDAMDARFRGSATDRLVNDCLDAGEIDRARGIIRGDGLTQLCMGTLQRLVHSGLITAPQSDAELGRRGQQVLSLGENPDAEGILKSLDLKALPLHEDPELWSIRAAALQNLGRHEEALEDIETCIRFVPGRPSDALLKAKILLKLSRFREAISVLCSHADEFAADPEAQTVLAISSLKLADFERAAAACETGLARQESQDMRRLLESVSSLRHLVREPLQMFAFLVGVDSFAEAHQLWNEKIRDGLGVAEKVAWVVVLANKGNLHFLRTLIRESNLDEELLPLAVAMDYLETGDRSPLEKLSAEVRPIAEEIVAELQKKLSQPEQAIGAQCT
jgi:Flp pilus assembly protein TadD